MKVERRPQSKMNSTPGGGTYEFTTAQRDLVVEILTNEKFHFGARAGVLLRRCPWLAFTPTAKLLYVLIAGFLPKETGTISISLGTMAGWLGCSKRNVQIVVRQLTRSGPLPLLREAPGRVGRASEFEFIRNPFASAEAQQAEAVRVRHHRNPAVVTAQADLMKAESSGAISALEAQRRLRETQKRRDWNTATRMPVRVKPSN